MDRRVLLVAVLVVVGLTLAPTAAAHGHCSPTCLAPSGPLALVGPAGLAAVAVVATLLRLGSRPS